jgi:predicted MFS family arabinose efflux permease
MAVNSGVWYSGSVFFVALIREFGWSYAATSGILSLFSILAGGWGILVGTLVDRVGARPIVLGGGIILGGAVAANGLASAPWHLYLTHSVLAALGLACIGWVPVSILLARRFAARRGLALGIASAGVGLGISVVVPLAQAMIEGVGLRLAYLGVGVLAAAVVLPVAATLPRDRPAGSRSRDAEEGQAGGWPLWRAVRRREFWGVAAVFVLLNAPVQLTLTHQVAHLIEIGMPRLAAAGVMGVLGLASIPAKVVWGFLSDRWRLEWTYTGGIAALVVGIAGLLLVGPGSPGWALHAAAVCIGVGYAVSPALTPVLTVRFFPGRDFGAVFGTLAMMHNTGGAVGVWLAGYAHDVTGSYRVPLVGSIACGLMAAAAVWLLAPRRARQTNPVPVTKSQ